MTELAKQDFSPPLRSHNWEAIERSLEIATKAEALRERSRKLREASRMIREESMHIARETQQHLHDPFRNHFSLLNSLITELDHSASG